VTSKITPSSHSESPVLSSPERIRRMRARSWVLQVLYVWETQEDRRALVEVMEELFRSRRVAKDREPLIRRHVEAISEHLGDLDDTIREAMDNWRLERLSRVDRSILRLAVAELLHFPDVPPRVVLQEGVRLAGQYGGHESPRFVNGVLDAVFRARGAPS